MSEFTPLTPAQRKRRSRALQKGLPDPYANREIAIELVSGRKDQHDIDLKWVQEWDAENPGKFYKSEARSLLVLLGIYEGNNILSEEDDEDDEEAPKKKKEKKINIKVNPSIQQIDIPEIDRGVGPNGELKFDVSIHETVSFQRWLDLRDKARKDLYWLCKLLGKDLYPDVHQVICDQFVQKNFDGVYHPGYTLKNFHDGIDRQQRYDINGIPTKEMMLLDSRGFYKSTINGIDCVQWLVNCPDIQIFILTGEYKLAVQFLQEIKEYFYLASGGEPSAFQLLFPEYVLMGVAGRSKQPLRCPAKVLKQKGNSVWVNAIVANLSGWHCDIKKGDDIVTDENSNTQDARESIRIKYDGTDDLLNPYGFSDHIGTRYFTDDWYGTRLMPDKESGEVSPVKYFKRGCWVVKPEYQKIPLTLLIEDMVTLTFPQVATFKKLRNKLLKKGVKFFKNQQLNEPSDAKEDSGFVVHFEEEVLRAHCRPKEAVPKIGRIFICWDWALSDKKTSDFSVGVVGLIYQKEDGQYAIFVLEIVYDKWKDSELVRQIIALYKKWNPEKVIIEASNGIDLLKTAIMHASYKLGVPEIMNSGVIYWKPVDTSSNAKKNRVKSVEILLDDDRFDIVNGNWIDETIKQLTQYTGEKSTASRKDDIPDALGHLVEVLPKTALSKTSNPVDVEREIEKQRLEEERKAAYQRLFGNRFPQQNKQESVATPPPPDPRRAMLNRLFGGNGMRA